MTYHSNVHGYSTNVVIIPLRTIDFIIGYYTDPPRFIPPVDINPGRTCGGGHGTVLLLVHCRPPRHEKACSNCL